MNGGGWTGLVVGGLTGLGTGSFGGFLAMAVIGRLVEIIRLPSYNLHHPAIKNKVVTEYHSITTLFFLQ